MDQNKNSNNFKLDNNFNGQPTPQPQKPVDNERSKNYQPDDRNQKAGSNFQSNKPGFQQPSQPVVNTNPVVQTTNTLNDVAKPKPVPNNLPTKPKPTSSDIRVVAPPQKVVSYQIQHRGSIEVPGVNTASSFEVLPPEYRGSSYVKNRKGKPKNKKIKEVEKKEIVPTPPPIKPEEKKFKEPEPQPGKDNVFANAKFNPPKPKSEAEKSTDLSSFLEKQTEIKPKPTESKTRKPKPQKIKGKNNYFLILLLIILILGGGVMVAYFRVWEQLPWLAPQEEEIIAPDNNPAVGGDMPGEVPSGEILPPDEPEGLVDNARDTDQDGLLDSKEIELGLDPSNPDTDGDGLPDGWEMQYNLNPLTPSDATSDLDNDGLLNQAEYRYGSDPSNPDTDNDGYKDGLEVENNYSPLNGPEVTIEEDPAIPSLDELGITEPETLTTNKDEELSDGLTQDTVVGRDYQRKVDIKMVALAVELYYDDNGYYPEDLSLLTPDYIKQIPLDPLSPQYDYNYEKLTDNSYRLRSFIESNDDAEDKADGALDHYYTIEISS